MKTLMRALMPALLAVVLSVSVQAARNPNPGVLPPQSNPFGMSYGNWGHAWWQWALSFDIAHNPVIDTTGEDAWNGQSGKVFFLAGTFGGDAERTVTIPTGTALFFPVNNWFMAAPYDLPIAFDPDPVPVDVTPAQAVQAMRDYLGAYFDTFTEDMLAVTVDGTVLKGLLNYRAGSDALPVYIGPNTISQEMDPIWYPVGTQPLSVSDGFWVMLAPLSPGPHEITIQAGPSDARWFTIVYHLTVKPRGRM